MRPTKFPKLQLGKNDAIKSYIIALEDALTQAGRVAPYNAVSDAYREFENLRARAWQICGYNSDKLKFVSPAALALTERKNESENS